MRRCFETVRFPVPCQTSAISLPWWWLPDGDFLIQSFLPFGCCSCSRFSSWSTFKMTPDRSSSFFKHFLTFGLLLCFPCPKSELSHFSFEWMRACRNPNPGARYEPCYSRVIWVLSADRARETPPSIKEPWVHTSVSYPSPTVCILNSILCQWETWLPLSSTDWLLCRVGWCSRSLDHPAELVALALPAYQLHWLNSERCPRGRGESVYLEEFLCDEYHSCVCRVLLPWLISSGSKDPCHASLPWLSVSGCCLLSAELGLEVF